MYLIITRENALELFKNISHGEIYVKNIYLRDKRISFANKRVSFASKRLTFAKKTRRFRE